MNLRESLGKNSTPAAAVAGAALLLSLFSIIRQVSSNTPPAPANKEFFSDDDGKTWFTSNSLTAFPFAHDGKQAYRARVFRCGSKLFCGYLEALPDQVREGINSLPDNWQARLSALQSASDQIMVKKPGGTDWVSPGQAKYWSTVTPVCPADSQQSPILVNANQ